MGFFENFIMKLIRRQNGGQYTKVLGANELFKTGIGNNHRISGIQFSTYPTTISVAKVKDRDGNIIDCIPLQAASGDSSIIVYDGTFVFGHEFGYVEFQCDNNCTINLVENNNF